MTKGGFFASGVAGFSALLVLNFAGIVALTVFAVWAMIAAIIAMAALLILEAKSGWGVTDRVPATPIPLQVAFLISGAAAFALDLIFKTYVSLPAMIDALDLTHFEHARREPLIQSVRDYYAFVLGPTPGTWLRFLSHYLVIVLVFAAVLLWFTLNIEPEPELYAEPKSPMKRNVQLLGVSAVAVGAVALTLFPVTTGQCSRSATSITEHATPGSSRSTKSPGRGSHVVRNDAPTSQFREGWRKIAPELDAPQGVVQEDDRRAGEGGRAGHPLPREQSAPWMLHPMISGTRASHRSGLLGEADDHVLQDDFLPMGHGRSRSRPALEQRAESALRPVEQVELVPQERQTF